jgi:prepilin-type N-terminal cleavage/methylation domain-containing protein
MIKQFKKKLRDNRGMTLIEIMLALTIMIVAFALTVSIFPNTVTNMFNQGYKTQSVYSAEEQLDARLSNNAEGDVTESSGSISITFKDSNAATISTDEIQGKIITSVGDDNVSLETFVAED